MTFNVSIFDKILPDYLTEPNKDRLRTALQQFKGVDSFNNVIDIYERQPFYHAPTHAEVLWQGDLVRNIPMSYFDIDNQIFDTDIVDAIILTNTCDMDSAEKNRMIDKNVLFAPLINLSEYVSDLRSSLSSAKVETIIKNIKSQQYSNIFFLPKNIYDYNQEYIVFLDQVSWLPIEYVKKIEIHKDKDRIASLHLLGFYLFVLKLSYHFCRLPEDGHRG
jgi:hypothetical protein